jgi:hypothetical protein
MSVQLLPRLTSVGVADILDSAGSQVLTPAKSRKLLNERSAMLSFAASGGHRSEELAGALGATLREIANGAGFPDNTSQVARSKFDHEAAIYLGSLHDLATGEALRDDVWSFLTIVVVPDIVAWRFPDRAAHRYEGGVRNALQRLWIRGIVLDRGEAHEDRWGLVRSLSEDAAVQIFERASIAGNRPLATALAEGWVRMAARIGRGAMEPVMRRATKLLRLRNEIVDISGLPQVDRDAVVSESFELAWQSIDK